MPEHDDKPGVETLRREFDAADLGRRDDVSGNADDKQITEALIEHDLRRASQIKGCRLSPLRIVKHLLFTPLSALTAAPILALRPMRRAYVSAAREVLARIRINRRNTRRFGILLVHHQPGAIFQQRIEAPFRRQVSPTR